MPVLFDCYSFCLLCLCCGFSVQHEVANLTFHSHAVKCSQISISFLFNGHFIIAIPCDIISLCVCVCVCVSVCACVCVCVCERARAYIYLTFGKLNVVRKLSFARNRWSTNNLIFKYNGSNAFLTVWLVFVAFLAFFFFFLQSPRCCWIKSNRQDYTFSKNVSGRLHLWHICVIKTVYQ